MYVKIPMYCGIYVEFAWNTKWKFSFIACWKPLDKSIDVTSAFHNIKFYRFKCGWNIKLMPQFHPAQRFHTATKCCDWVYSGSPGFKSCPWVSLTGFLWYSPVPWGIRGIPHIWHFLTHPFQFVIHNSSYHFDAMYLVWATDNIIKP